MQSNTGISARRPGISRTVYAISLVVVAAAAGIGGYFANSIINPGVPTLQLSGSGSSLVYPLLSTWSTNYNKLHSNVQINYASVGSSTGITDFQNKVVDFAGTDFAPTATTLSGWNVTLTIPETIGAVVIAYNVQGLSKGLHLNETVAAKIFQGNITMWNDNMIQALNSGVTLPASPIATIHRGDGSGTTFIFTSYLYASGVWNSKPDKNWPNGIGGTPGQQNTGVATLISTTPNSVGYVEVAYAITSGINVAYLQNKDRNAFVQPTLANITSAVASANTSNLPAGLQSWSAVSLILQPGANSYPIVAFTYILVYQQLNVRPLMTLGKAKALVDFLWFIVHDGQSVSNSQYYPTLPQSIVTIDETSIKSITYNGQSLPT